MTSPADRQWSRASEERLRLVYPPLRRMLSAALVHPAMPYDLGIPHNGGARDKAAQRLLVDRGASRTMHSRHVVPSLQATPDPNDIRGWAAAVDVVPWVSGRLRWEWGPMRQVAEVMFAVAFDHGIPLVWGGHWPDFPDGAHFELSSEIYPDSVRLG